MALPSAEPLFAHLCALRDADDVYASEHADRWRAIADWLARAFRGTAPEAEDARQETLVSLLRHVKGMQAESPLQAAKWVSTIHRRKRFDHLRVRQRDPVHEGLKSTPRDPQRPAPIDRLEANTAPTPAPGAIEALVTTTLEHVHRALEETVPSASKRALRRTQAQATLLRLVLEWDAEAIVQALDHGEPVSKDRLYKWVERGREPVRLGLDRWAATAPADQREELVPILDALREIIDERRADAGRPRPDRRREPSAEGP